MFYFQRKKLECMKELWLQDLKRGFTRDVAILKSANKHAGISLLPYMKVLDLQDYIDIMMKVCTTILLVCLEYLTNKFPLIVYTIRSDTKNDCAWNLIL